MIKLSTTIASLQNAYHALCFQHLPSKLDNLGVAPVAALGASATDRSAEMGGEPCFPYVDFQYSSPEFSTRTESVSLVDLIVLLSKLWLISLWSLN